jgi:hypothetical protein
MKQDRNTPVELCKHHFVMQLLQNPPLCSNTALFTPQPSTPDCYAVVM